MSNETIHDDVLENFLYWCVEIVVLMIRRFEKQWYFLSKKPIKDEIDWFYFVCGKNYVTNLFTQIEVNKVKKRTIKDLYIEYCNLDRNKSTEWIGEQMNPMEKTFPDFYTKKGINKELEIADRKIQQDLKFIDSKKEYFLHIKTNYGWILPSLKEIIRPRFLENKFASDFFDS